MPCFNCKHFTANGWRWCVIIIMCGDHDGWWSWWWVVIMMMDGDHDDGWWSWWCPYGTFTRVFWNHIPCYTMVYYGKYTMVQNIPSLWYFFIRVSGDDGWCSWWCVVGYMMRSAHDDWGWSWWVVIMMIMMGGDHAGWWSWSDGWWSWWWVVITNNINAYHVLSVGPPVWKLVSTDLIPWYCQKLPF